MPGRVIDLKTERGLYAVKLPSRSYLALSAYTIVLRVYLPLLVGTYLSMYGASVMMVSSFPFMYSLTLSMVLFLSTNSARTVMSNVSPRVAFKDEGLIYRDICFFPPGNGLLAFLALSVAMYDLSQVIAGRSEPFL